MGCERTATPADARSRSPVLGSRGGPRGAEADGAPGRSLRACRVEEGTVQLHFSDGKRAAVPGVYLRDNCCCTACLHPTTGMRRVMVSMTDPAHKAPAKATVGPDGELSLEWPDGHATTLSSEWLRCRVLPRANPQEDIVTWDAAWLRANLDVVTFPFQAVVGKSGPDVLAWLDALWKYGLTRLVGAPAEVEQVRRLAQSVRLPLRKTIYGGDLFDVKVKPNAANQAYTPDGLGMHTDLPYYSKPPDVQILHCIVAGPASDGGQSTFSDGFAAAGSLRGRSAAAYEILGRVPVVFEDVNVPQYHMEGVHSVLELDASGGLAAVNLSNFVRSSLLGAGHGDPASIRAHYEAMADFQALLEGEEHRFEHSTRPGEVWVFNNRRVLHGRRAFSGRFPRHLQGGYMEWDDIHSLRRLLRSDSSASFWEQRKPFEQTDG